MPRSPIKDFQLGSRAYVNASVSFYTVAGGERTATLATLYAAETGTETLGNPVKLDGYGKFKRIPYIDVQVIGVVNGLGIPSHETGVISPAPTFRVNSSTSALEYSYDGGVSWNDSNGDIFKPRGAWAGPGTAYNLLDLVTNGGIVYVCVIPHTSAAAFATDLAASRWVTLVSFTAAAIANVPAGGISATNVQDALNELDTEKAPKASPTFTGNPTAPTPSPGDNDTSIATTAFVVAAIAALAAGPSADLVEMLHIDSDTAHRDMIADGWMPAFFNQQWGGAPHYFELVDGVTGTSYKFEAATGYIEDFGAISSVAAAAGNTWVSQGFKVSQTGSYANIWIKVYKVGNPTNNLEMRILPDDGTGKPSGSTAIPNGTATSIGGKLFSSDTGGQWVRFTFSTPPTLTAGTQYHITLKSSGAVDASNYWILKGTYSGFGKSGAYPHGYLCQGDATPTWTGFTGHDSCFFVEAPTSLASIQTGGIFNEGKLTFFEGSPLNQSNGRVKDLRDFRGLDLTDCTLLIRGSAWTKDKTILDIQYGMDHDRIVLRSAITTGYPTLTVYEQDGSVHTVTGTTDVSSGNHDIGIRIRAKNDGSDEIELWVDGASQGTPISSANIAFDTLFGLAQIGTAWIGGGFALAPTWSGSSISSFTGLPSTLGWTYAGAATESSAFSVSGGKLYQSYAGFGAAQDGYYRKTTAGLSNANGWALVPKMRVTNSTNTKTSGACFALVYDGTKGGVGVICQEYFAEMWQSVVASMALPQADLQSTDFVLGLTGKGSDVLAFINGRLVFDGTGQLTNASATNEINICDVTASSGENADVVHSYWKYYSTAWLPPQFTSGSLSEIAFWNGDKTSLLNSLYNSGAFTSVKQFCGLGKNYVGEGVVQQFARLGITSNPTATATTIASATPIPEMEAFVVSSSVSAETGVVSGNNAAGNWGGGIMFIDGVPSSSNGHGEGIAYSSANNYFYEMTATIDRHQLAFGLHKVEYRGFCSSSTQTYHVRNMSVEARA